MAPEPSLEGFVTARGPALVRFAYVLTGGDAHRAEDLVQSALAKVIGRWARICRGGHPEAYLRRVVVNEELSWRRRRSATEQVVATPPDRGAGVDQHAAVDGRDLAWRLLAGLPRRQRAVLVLRYLEDWPDAEIAVALRCSEATVRSQASRALAGLRRDLGAARVPQAVRGDEHA